LGTVYYRRNILTSSVYTLERDGKVAAHMTYDDWGKAETEPRMDLNYAGLEQMNDYGGYTYDEVLDLYYVQNRFYDPANRRWTSPDPHWGPDNLVYGDNGTVDQADGLTAIQVTLHIRAAIEIQIAGPRSGAAANAILLPNPPDPAALAQSANLYAYVLDNPLRYIDPWGLALGWEDFRAAEAQNNAKLENAVAVPQPAPLPETGQGQTASFAMPTSADIYGVGAVGVGFGMSAGADQTIVKLGVMLALLMKLKTDQISNELSAKISAMISDLSNELSDLAGEIAEEIADLADRIADVWDDYFGKPTYDLPWEQGKGIPHIQIRPGNPGKSLTKDKPRVDVNPPDEPPKKSVYQLAYITQYGDLQRLPGDMNYTTAALALGYTGKINKASVLANPAQEYDCGSSSDAQRKLEHLNPLGKTYWGIYTHDQLDAKALIVLFGQSADSPRVHGSGMYGHYNDVTHTFHVWFGPKLQY
jgi:RHS repeat-associated protein